jgi:hypothetical protein
LSRPVFETAGPDTRSVRRQRCSQPPANSLAQLQRSAGNRAVQRLLAGGGSPAVQRQQAGQVLEECRVNGSGAYVVPGTPVEKVNRAIAAGHFRDAFCLLNGLWMVHLLEVLDAIGPGQRNTLRANWSATAGYGSSRLSVAFTAINRGDMCRVRFPADLPPAQQVEIKTYLRAHRPVPALAYTWQVPGIRELVEGPVTWQDAVLTVRAWLMVLDPAQQQLAVRDLEGARLAYNAAGRGECAEVLNQVRYALFASDVSGAAPMSGTHVPDAAEQERIKQVLTPPRQLGLGGRPPDFHRRPPGTPADYETRVRTRVDQMINELHAHYGAPRSTAAHRDPARVDPMSRFLEIANAAKAEADHVFGGYASGPAFTTGNLKDWWEDAEQALSHMTPEQQKTRMQGWLKHLMVSDQTLADINRVHGAIPSRTQVSPGEREAEATILDRIRTTITNDATKLRRLMDIYRGWDGMQRPGTVYLQRFRASNALEQRRQYWDMFQVSIHEYMHSLMHPAYRTYAMSFAGAESEQYNTLVEGVACLLAETVWPRVQPRVTDPALRARVESAAYAALPFDPNTVPEPRFRRYPAHDQAMRLADVTGIRNLYAAFFRGQTQLIRAAP